MAVYIRVAAAPNHHLRAAGGLPRGLEGTVVHDATGIDADLGELAGGVRTLDESKRVDAAVAST